MASVEDSNIYLVGILMVFFVLELQVQVCIYLVNRHFIVVFDCKKLRLNEEKLEMSVWESIFFLNVFWIFQ